MKTNTDCNCFVKSFKKALVKIGAIFSLIFTLSLGFSNLAKATDILVPTAFTTLDSSDGAPDDVFNVAGDLHILNGGSITGPGGAFGIKINITGNLIIDIGASINGNVNGANLAGITIDVNVTGDIILHGNGTTGASITSDQIAGSCSGSVGHGGNITLIAGGNFIIEDGSKITSDSRCTAGFIYIKAAGIVDIDGFVESHAALSGTGANQAPGGGPVTIIGGCSLNISDNGIVSSRGQDPGADLVHLEACAVIIYGLVQSTGVGHALPDDSITHVVPPYRPEKPANSAAGVEVWAGTIIINSVPPHQGEVKADLTIGAGSVAWIDLFAQNDINIIGDSIGNFAVHANNGGNQNQGGFISVKSVGAIIDATGRAFQANGAFGGSGGVISLEANNDLTLSGAEFDEATGVSNDGGNIILKSFNGDIVSTLAVVINVSAPSPGTVTRTACGTIGPATIIPGSVIPSDNSGGAFCGGNPAIFPEDSLPDCAANVICNITGDNFCQGDSTELCAPAGMDSYLWSTNETTQCITVDSAGTYTVTVTDANGCTSSCTTEITVNNPPSCSIAGSDTICPGDTTTYDAPAGMDTYEWSITGNGTINGATDSSSVEVISGGSCGIQYTLTLTVTLNGCTATCTKDVNVADTTPPTITCPQNVSISCDDEIPVCDPNDASAADDCDQNVAITCTQVVDIQLGGSGCSCTTPAPASFCTPPSTFDVDVIVSGNTTWAALIPGVNPSSITQTIRIHGSGQVIVQNSDVKLTSASAVLVVDSVEFIVDNGNLILDATGSRFIMTNAILRTSGNAQLKPETFMCITGSTVEIGDEAAGGIFNSNSASSTSADFQNDGGYRFLQNVCLNVTHDLQLSSTGDGTIENGGLDIFINVCGEIGDEGATHASNGTVDGADSGNLQDNKKMQIYCSEFVVIENIQVQSSSFMEVCEVDFRTLNGSLQNSGDLSGTGLCLAIDDQINQNSGSWTAAVEHWFAGGIVTGNPPLGLESTLSAVLDSCFNDCSCAPACSGTITITYTATDDCGNSSTCSRTISVTDNTAPTITCPIVSDVECPGTPSFGVATATDACDTSPDITFSDASTPGNCPQEYSITRTWTATDGCGNSSTCSRTVNIVDTTDPIITCPNPTATVECPGTPSFGVATATDACDPSPAITFNDVSTPGNCPQEYSITRTWTATDDCGNTATCSRTVNVVDTTDPIITCPNPTSPIECPGGSPSFGVATATDACDPSLDITFSDASTPGNCPQEYSITRTWTATDDCGNSSTCSRTVNVVDTTDPIITCPNPTATVECPATPSFGVATATDACDPSPDITFSNVSTPGNCPQEYSITRTWTATDNCGNTSTCSRTINVTDDTPPSITCPPNQILLCGATIVWGNPTVGDACSTPTVVPSTVDNRDTCGNGTVVRTWTATDACGNSNSCSKTITFNDCGGVSLLKTTEGVVNPGMDWNFTLKDVTTNTVLANQNTLGDLNGILFENIGPLTASHKYVICENNIPAGWSVIVKADLNGDGTAESIVAGYNPDLNNVPPQNLGNLCFEFGFGTAIPLPVGNPLIGCKFVYWADNTFPGGDPRTPGYWKNWNCCTSGGQCAHALSAGGCDSGYCIVEDVIFAPGPGITWCNNTTVGDNSPTLNINSCQMAVWILDQRDICANNHPKRASDAAYTLAMHLLAAELNFAVGAEMCPTAQLALAYGRQLLCSVNYDGCGDILKKATDPKYAKALCIKNCLEKYNTGNLCPSGTCVSCSGYPFREDQSFADFIVSDELITSFPNPATDNSTILFMVGEDAHAVLEVYSYNGAKVASLLDREVHAGETVSVEFNTGSLSKGIYFCKLEMGGNVYAHKISVIK